jgi:hypothetical protein
MPMSAHTLLALAAASILTLSAQVAQAKDPNITGMWVMSPPDGGQQMRQPMRPKLTAAAQNEGRSVQSRDAKNNRIISESHTKCWPTGMPAMMTNPFGIQFLQTPGRITVLNEVSNLPRAIYLDEKDHPDTYIPGWNGHSIGHWEKDVLVVDTVGFNGRSDVLMILAANGPTVEAGGIGAAWTVSEKLHLIEKIYLDKDGYLHDDITMEDPATLAEPYTAKYRYKRAHGREANEVMEYVCEVDPANLNAFEREQKDAGLASTNDPAWAIEGFTKPASSAATATLAPSASPPPK